MDKDVLRHLLDVINEDHKETLQHLAEVEKKELSFDLEMAELVWQKVKGYPIPDCYSTEDRLSILERYWHRAMNSEDLD